MNLTVTKTPFGMRPPVTKPLPQFLTEVGEEGIRKIINDHYESIRNSDIAHLFPMDEKEFEAAKKHASDFFIQICGGPDYFNQSRGAPKMIGRHAPFRIDAHAREVWLELYIPLLKQLENDGVSTEPIQSFWNYLDIFSLWMINTQ